MFMAQELAKQILRKGMIVVKMFRGRTLRAVAAVLVVAASTLIPMTTAVALDETVIDERFMSEAIWFSDQESEKGLSSALYFTKVDENGVDGEEIILDGLEENATYTMHVLFRNTSFSDLRDAAIYVPLVANKVKVSADSEESQRLLDFMVTGTWIDGSTKTERGFTYNKSYRLSSDDGVPMDLSYVPNTARCYSKTWNGEEREALLSDVDLCSEEFGALISSEVERYGTEENPQFRVGDFGIEPGGGTCEVRMTVQTSAKDGANNLVLDTAQQRGDDIGDGNIEAGTKVTVMLGILAIVIAAVILIFLLGKRNKENSN